MCQALHLQTSKLLERPSCHPQQHQVVLDASIPPITFQSTDLKLVAGELHLRDYIDGMVDLLLGQSLRISVRHARHYIRRICNTTEDTSY